MGKTVIIEHDKPCGCSSLVCPARSKCKRILFLDIILPFKHDEKAGKCDYFMEIKGDH